MLKHEGFATAQKVKLSFLGVGVMDDAILKVLTTRMLNLKDWLIKRSVHKELTTNTSLFTIILRNL